MMAGTVTTLAGTPGPGGHADGNRTAAIFNRPTAIGVDRLHNVFVADTGNRVIRRISSGGDVTTFAGTVGIDGDGDGHGTAASVRNPVALANDSAGNLYVVDKQYGGSVGVHDTVRLRKISPTGSVTTIATNDSTFAVLSDGIAVDLAGNLYVVGVVGSDTVTRTLQPGPGGPPPITITARTPKLLQISAAGEVAALGTVKVEGKIGGVTTEPSGNVYLSNYAFHTIYKYLADTKEISVFAGSFGGVWYDSHGLPSYSSSPGSADDVGEAAQFNRPMGLAAGSDGHLYIADQRNYIIRRASPQAMVTTIAGSAVRQGAVDGTALEATFGSSLKGSAVDSAGNIYVTDTLSQVVRKLHLREVWLPWREKRGRSATLTAVARLRGLTFLAEQRQTPWAMSMSPIQGIRSFGKLHRTVKSLPSPVRPAIVASLMVSAPVHNSGHLQESQETPQETCTYPTLEQERSARSRRQAWCRRLPVQSEQMALIRAVLSAPREYSTIRTP